MKTCMTLLLAGIQVFAANWYKGQLHCHSTNSFDGSNTPAEVVSMYKSAGYNFTAISEHNFITQAQPYTTSSFLTIQNDELSRGEPTIVPGECTGGFHVNAINISGTQQPSGNPSTLQESINLALSGGAGVIPQINHPAASHYSASQILTTHGAVLMEVMQGSGTTGNAAIWDTLLSTGVKIYGTGTDDMHNSGNFNRDWIMVRADTLTLGGILTALRNGDFYASNGPNISSITMGNRTLTVNSNGNKVTFIGKYGTVLQIVNSGSGSYALPAGGLYVRAVVSNSSGGLAYTQPYFPDSGNADTIAPSRPANLKATPVTPSQINLTWNASADPSTGGGQASGVTGYNIYRNGTKIGTSTTNAYSNTGITSTTLYAYWISAYDAAGNVSLNSDTATCSTGTPNFSSAESVSVVAGSKFGYRIKYFNPLGGSSALNIVKRPGWSTLFPPDSIYGTAPDSNRLDTLRVILSVNNVGYDTLIARIYVGKSVPMIMPTSQKSWNHSLNITANGNTGKGADFILMLPQQGEFDLQVYDISGRGVWAYREGIVHPGMVRVSWKKSPSHGISDGLYIACLKANDKQFQKMFSVLR